MTISVLVVDTDQTTRDFLSHGLTNQGFDITVADGGRDAMSLLRQNHFDAIITELTMPEVDGLDLLRFTQTLTPAPCFFILTSYGSVSIAVKAIKYGATEFLEKPVSVSELKTLVECSLPEHHGSRNGNEDIEPLAYGLVGHRSWLKPFMDCLKRISRTDATVLIQGETGTGKSLVAREIWRASNRSEGPFIEVNCAAIPEHLLESELFGHVRGSFTGATTTRVGKVEAARGGTIFLDEVGELRLDLQSKLLQLLQERTFQAIGSNRTIQADVRFIAATNRNLLHEVQERRFRADLYYRLNVVGLTVPPLRDRPEDVRIFVEHFCSCVAQKMSASTPRFADESIALLERAKWPGNVRELENLIQRMAVIFPAGTVLIPEHFQQRAQFSPNLISEGMPEHENESPDVRPSPPPAEVVTNSQATAPEGSSPGLQEPEALPLAEAVQKLERDLILRALKQCEGNRSHAAKLLGTKRTTLIEKIKRLNLDSLTT